MSTLPPDEIPPVAPIEHPSRNELELARAQAKVAELEAKVQAEREARDQASTAMRALAIALHRNFCTEKHDGTGECQWHSDSNADSPTAADFTPGRPLALDSDCPWSYVDSAREWLDCH